MSLGRSEKNHIYYLSHQSEIKKRRRENYRNNKKLAKTAENKKKYYEVNKPKI